MEKKVLKTTSGNMFFYTNTGTTYGLLSMNIRMTERVERDILQRAVDTAMERYPYLCVKPEIRDEAYVLVPNERPFVVTDDGEFTPLGEEASNFHLMTFTCKDDEIRINYDHALVDGRGGLDTIYSILYYYCRFKYNRDFDCPGVKTMAVPIDPEEYESPYVRELPPSVLPDLRQHLPWYRLPETGTGEPGICCVHTLLVNQRSFLETAKSGDSSPASMAALLLLRAVEEVHPEHENNLVCLMPAEYRAAIGMTETHQNSFTRVPLFYNEKIKKMPFDRQQTAMRGQVIARTDPDQLIKLFRADQERCRQAMELNTLEEKRKLYRDAGPLRTGYPLCTYIGQCKFGEIEQYIRAMHLLHAGYDCILLEVTAVGENFGFDFSFGFDGAAYMNAYLRQLDELGILYRRDRDFRFRLPVKTY
ncbi:MAG: hypothetical protein HUJ73_00785 [Eubacterium sp.]|nr:hypothetical protein [Eubacterium sp.]